ncbi:Ig-like domain repeat protein [Microbacterium sp. ZW T2_14]|uniref:Ig-like domain repeat protein n=1 Tax=Microbacterium sp. ZW T2_14 TaxID=3378079 RepID=UPI003854D0D5
MARSDAHRSAAAPGRLPRRGVAASIALLLALFGTMVASPARADGPTTFTNAASIAIPATGSADQVGAASPYPSPITVSGLAGTVSSVRVVFNGLTHSALNDLDAMVVAPSGENLVLLSDIGDPTSTLAFATGATLTFDDAAAGGVPTGNVPTGTYRPTNNVAGDSFLAPAPAPSAQTTLAGAFTGIDANGTWQLFIVDDTTGDLGQMAGGWSLVITTQVTAAPTVTTVTTSGTPSVTGAPVTITASVNAAGVPVTVGTVSFTLDGAPVAPVFLSASGTASITLGSPSEGTHAITATYSGAPGFLTSNGSVSQRVDNATVVTGTTYCNPGAFAIPSNGTASPYPSNITVSGLTAPVSKVTATLNGVSHAVPVDLDVLLSGPVPTTNVLLMSDVGGTSPVNGATIVLDDAAAGPVPTPLVTGTFRPTDDDADAADTAFPAPAPAPSGATALAAFNGVNGNGVWSLWVLDDATGDAGSISGGWCLTFTTASPTTTLLTSSPSPSSVGQPVTFTAIVTSGPTPVSTGSVSFSEGGIPLASGVVVDASGRATLVTSDLGAGSHVITATYSGAPAYAGSGGNLLQVVQQPAPVAVAGGPYSVAEGGSLSLDGSGSTPGATYQWDVDGDGAFTDASGPSPTLTWAQLEALGITDGPSVHTVAIRVDLGNQAVTDTAELAVTNASPTAVVTGAAAATADVPFTMKVGAEDPSSADMASLFTYTIDWGDGTPVVSLSGPADPPVTHVYAAAGVYTASVTATDKDGATSAQFGVAVFVAAAPAPTTPPPPPGAAALPATGADPMSAAVVAGVLLLLGGSLVATRRNGTSRRHIQRAAAPR